MITPDKINTINKKRIKHCNLNIKRYERIMLRKEINKNILMSYNF
jgi:K+/H+ antiporter YhaU regulatory subunit KhtT